MGSSKKDFDKIVLNDLKIKGSKPISENLSTVTVGDQSTCLEISDTNGARVVGDFRVTQDLLVAGDIKGNIKDMVLEDVTLDSLTTDSIISTDLTITANNGNVYMNDGTSNIFDFDVDDPSVKIMDDANTSDYFKTSVGTNGATTIATIDAVGNEADLTFNVDGFVDINTPSGEDITLDAGGNIYLNPATSMIRAIQSEVTTFELRVDGYTSAGCGMTFASLVDSGDYFRIDTTTLGATTITTVDDGDSGDGVSADLTFNIDGLIDFNSASGEDITFDSGGVITFESTGTTTFDRDISLSSGRVIYFDSADTKIGSNSDNPEDMVIEADQDILMSPDAALVVDAGGGITLDAGDGVFISMNAGTEFSAANSSYSGMLLGCTHVFGSGTGGVFVSISNTFANLVWDTDKFALVTFVVPPSNIVKISVHLPWVQAASIAIQLGLATDSSATTLGTKYQNDVDDANRADNFNINYSWVVEGSDHSWSAGETKTLYIMAYAASSMRFYTGGTNTSGYGGVIVEATALPTTIGDGSEP